MALSVLLASTACAGTVTQPPQSQSLRDVDRLQIAELSDRFGDAVNRHDWETMASMFTEDAAWEAAAAELGFRHKGRAAIRKFLVENPNGVEILAYQTTAPFIERLSAHRAKTRLAMTEYLRIKATGETKRIVGIYSDELVKRDGRWQFAHRSFVLQAVFDEQPASL
ncbi:MAG TPA: nuclear transport factor 2 family protein [Opitutaceae bacterium]|nr:nuclear transport factor 2 family protein [Opitutaceae bacterium]